MATFFRPDGWHRMSWEERRVYQERWDKTPEGMEHKRHGRGVSFWVEPDGTFRIDDVAAGHYRLSLALYQDDGGPTRFTDRVAEATRAVNLDAPAGGRSDEPLDLGTITLSPRPLLKLGKPAPPLPIKSLDGAPVKLGDFAGKFVLLVPWADGRRPSREDLESIKLAHARHGGGAGRLAILTLEFTDDPAVARRLAKETGLETLATHCVGQHSGNPLTGLFKPTVPREYFESASLIALIDPDGNVAAKNLSGAQIEQAVHRAVFAR
jgi:hypothetical protein